MARGGKELLLEAGDSGVALLQQLQALFAFERFDPQLLRSLLDVVTGRQLNVASKRRQGGKSAIRRSP